MTVKRLLAISCIVACTGVAWFLLAETVNIRSASTSARLTPEVEKNWGPVLKQEQPTLYYETPGDGRSRREIQPEQSSIQVTLTYEPKNKGLLWYRTYFADFEAEYLVKNPTPIPQTIYAAFHFPAADARYDRFSLTFGEKTTDKEPENGQLVESLQLAPGAEAPLKVTYRASGVDSWSYVLAGAKRTKNLHLAMMTNFHEFNVPVGAESPTSRGPDGRHFNWDYTDVIGAHAIAMDMPAVTNPGYVAGRMTFFAPVSLLFFFAVLVIVAARDRIDLHPMNYFFLAAGCFAFQLLFAYLVDLVPLLGSFLIAATVSMVLVNGYLWRAASAKFARIAAVAQFAYMVLFSYSFFFDGLTGITIAIGAVITLALLMAFTARVNWETALTSRVGPPPLPVRG
jgi:hypothetical protein